VEGGARVAMRSPINWALLGLVIQRPSYGYELVQRFERTFGEALELSSPSQIYTALDALVRHALIETVPGEELSVAGGRQPKPHYRATVEGTRDYERWLIGWLQQERRRSRLFAQQLAVLAPAAALRVLERCEQACLREASSARAGGAVDGPSQDVERALADRLAAEEDRLAIRARLDWIEHARGQLKALVSARSAAP